MQNTIQLRVYLDPDQTYRIVAFLRLATRNVVVQLTGIRVAWRRLISGLDGDNASAETGSDARSSWWQRFVASVRPGLTAALAKIVKVLNHPLAALAAASSVLIPGVGPAALVTYALGTSALNTIEGKLR